MTTSTQVLLLPSDWARQEYERYSVYLCYDHRPFIQPYSHLAFYEKQDRRKNRPGKIYRIIPAVLNMVEAVELTRNIVEAWLDASEKKQLVDLIDRLERDERANRRVYQDGRLGGWHKVIFLSHPNSPDTLRLPQDVIHNLGGPFARAHRYFTLDTFKQKPKTTSELLAFEKT